MKRNYGRFLRDKSIAVNGREKSERIELGLHLLAAHSIPGARWTGAEIAAWCGCTYQAINRIERRALAKLRRNPNVKVLMQ